ncbi:MAG: ABC transporter ATP-binding protein [Candidatus Thermoplasmatota archaeon]
MIAIKNLSKYYGKKTALQDVNIVFNDGVITAIMGENGAGKSTLLKICAGIIPMSTGEVIIDGYSLIDQPVEAKKHLGYLPEIPDLYDRLTGREFLYYIASLRRLDESDQRINNLSDMMGISDSLDYEIGGYSKGMKQKISLISAILHNPENLLLDEPIYGLDPLASRVIQGFIKSKQGTTVIATHSTRLVEEIADMVYLLKKGRIIYSGMVKDVTREYGSVEDAYFKIKGDETCLKSLEYY